MSGEPASVTRRGLLSGAAAAASVAALGARVEANEMASSSSASEARSEAQPSGDRQNPIVLAKPIALADLPTPALLIDEAALERNLRKMAAHAARKKIGLRPHVKTHKCPILAKKQIALGALGVCAATVSEAVVMVDAGVGNVLITSPLASADKFARVVALAKRAPGLQVVVDASSAVRAFEAAAGPAGITLGVLIDLDTGTRRTGIAPGEPALALAREIGAAKHLRFDGLQAYAGHVMHIVGREERKKKSLESLAAAIDTKALLERNGIAVKTLTGGGTGTFDIDCDVPGMTDLQVGSYLFMDVQYRMIGDVDGELFDTFEPSLTVLATAISQPVPQLITIDAGFKAFAHEPEARPQFKDRAGLEYFYGGDEHGICAFKDETHTLALGDKAELIVSHCDPTVNLYDAFHVVRDGMVRELWPIAARGKSQ
jgi:D-serine deaminase-like pyridoxal phosphate-dependent protein